ncbi:MAG: hypothetical protein CMJ83_13430 [Planctomycetes bacterium]|nr:hypothetical protein [Planctomycetota bacterium]
MNDMFQEHKKFLVTHVAGLLVFLILWLIVGAMFNSDIARNKRKERTSKLKAAQSVPKGVSIRELREAKTRQDDAIKRLRAAVERSPASEYTLAGVSDPDLHYNAITQKIRDEVVEECMIRNVEFLEAAEELGRPTKFPKLPHEFAWYLRGLEMVRQVLDLVVKAHEDVLPEGVARIERINIKAPGRKRRNRREFLSFVPVEIQIVGHPSSVAYIIEELTLRREGQAQIVKKAHLRSLDVPPGLGRRGRARSDPLDQGRVEARIELHTVLLDEKGALRKASAR